MSALHVILGTGPVGTWIARTLRVEGHAVRAVTRTGGRGALPADVEVVAADCADPSQATRAAEGAAVVYQALNPRYHRWVEEFPALQAAALAAARAAGARYVSIDNLYMDGARAGTMNEASRERPDTVKGRLRAAMATEVLAALERGDVRATILRSSDYYGPGVLGSAFGERVYLPLLKGKAAQVSGAADVPHAFAYIEDVARAAVALGTRDDALGQIWFAPHTPALTQREMVDLAAKALGVQPRLQVIGPLMMRLAGLFIPEARASVEMLYQFDAPFLVDSSRITAAFGLVPTPVEEAVARTAAWYRARSGS
jgi:nucleoside-diphosphate-sugar epimerase